MYSAIDKRCKACHLILFMGGSITVNMFYRDFNNFTCVNKVNTVIDQNIIIFSHGSLVIMNDKKIASNMYLDEGCLA